MIRLFAAASLLALTACQTPAPAAPPQTLASLGHQGLDPASGKAPKQLVVFFHGYTQKGEAMRPLAEAMARRLPDAAFVFDNGPITQGAGFSWYNFRSEDTPQTMAAGKTLVTDKVKALSAAYRVPPQNIVTIGFSQGGGMAFDAGACQSPDVKAVVSLAGVLESTCQKEASGSPASVLIVWNEGDPTVKKDRIDAFQSALKTAGYDSKLETFQGTTHWPAADGLKRAEDFVVAQLGGR
jgi:predicted esterase